MSLRHRNFRLFFAGQLVSLIGTWIQNTAQGWLVYDLTGSKMLLGLVAAAGSAPLLLFSMWGGSLADRHPKRTIVLLTQAAMMTSAFALAILTWGGWVQPWHIVALAAATGAAMAFDMPARQSFMVEMTSREDLTNAISLNSSIVNGARVVGPSVAAILMASMGIAACFFLNGLSFVAVIASLLLMRLPEHRPTVQTSSGWIHAVEGFPYVWHNHRMRILLTLFAVVGVFGWSYAVLMPAFARDVLGIGQERYGVLLSANGIGALVGALTVASVGAEVSRRRLVLGGVWVFSAMLVLLSIVHSFWLALLFLAVAGWGMLLFFSTVNTVLQTTSTDEMRGRVMGIWTLVFGGTTPLGGLVAGAVSHYVGVRWTIALGAGVCALAALLVWLLIRKQKGRNTTATDAKTP